MNTVKVSVDKNGKIKQSIISKEEALKHNTPRHIRSDIYAPKKKTKKNSKK